MVEPVDMLETTDYCRKAMHDYDPDPVIWSTGDY